MKQIVCEICGSSDLIKEDGVFICQSCGCKYSVEEVKKMMVEGTVEVEGTVKVDRSTDADKIRINADNTFTDGNYKEAFDLFSQVININPEDAHSILYRGLSSAWQSTVKSPKIIEADKTYKRALQMKHDQVGDSEEFFLFATDALVKAAVLLNAVAQMYVNYYNRAKPTNLTISGAIATSNISAQVKETLKKGTTNCCVIACNISYYLSNLISDYTLASELFYAQWKTLLKNTLVYQKNANLTEDSSKINALISDVENKKQNILNKKLEAELKEQQERFEKYWNEHQEEKTQLLKEKDVLEQKCAATEQKIEEIPGISEKENIRQQIGQLKREIDALGLFKGKEKKIKQEEIDDLMKRSDFLDDAIRPVKNAMEDEIIANKKRIKEIERELNKAR